MKVHGGKITRLDADFDDVIRYDIFCYNKLIEYGYSPQGRDMKTDKVCVMKHKDLERYWDTADSKVYHFDSYIDAAEELLGITQNGRETNTPNHITMQMWTEAGSFDRIAKAGDTVDDEIVEQFRNSLPPVANGKMYMQAGGAYADIFIKELNTYAPLYATFKKREPSEQHPTGIWVYLGNCLRYETEDRTPLVKNL